MKKTFLAALILGAAALGQEGEGQKLLTDLQAANAAGDAGKIDLLLKEIIIFAESTKDQALADALGGELVKSLKPCKGNWGTIRGIMEAMGALRSKKALGTLKKAAFRKEPAEGNEEAVQAEAIKAIGRYRDPKLLEGLEEQCKSKNVEIAKAAYESFKHFAPEPGKVRQRVAEVVMKRMDAEYPAAAPGSGGVSAEANERWGKLQATVVATMQAVCHQPTINDIENWHEWWRENKKNAKAWKDEPKEGEEKPA